MSVREGTFRMRCVDEIAEKLGMLGASVTGEEISRCEPAEKMQRMVVLLLETALETRLIGNFAFRSPVETAQQLDAVFAVCGEELGIVPSRKLLASPASDRAETIAVFSGLINFIGYRRKTLADKKKKIEEDVKNLETACQIARQNSNKIADTLKKEKTKFASSAASEKLRNLEKEISDLTQKIAVAKSRGATLDREESETSGKVKQTESEISSLGKQISEEEATIGDFSSFDSLASEKAKLEERSEILKKEISGNESRMRQREAERQLSEEAVSVISRASEMIGKIEQLNGFAMEQNKQIQIGNSKLHKISEEFSGTQQKQQSLQQKIGEMQTQLEIAAGARSLVEQKISKAAVRLEQQLAAERECDRKFRELQTRGRQETTSLQEQIGNFDRKISSVPETLKNMQLEHGKLLRTSEQKLEILASRVRARY